MIYRQIMMQTEHCKLVSRRNKKIFEQTEIEFIVLNNDAFDFGNMDNRFLSLNHKLLLSQIHNQFAIHFRQ